MIQKKTRRTNKTKHFRSSNEWQIKTKPFYRLCCDAGCPAGFTTTAKAHHIFHITEFSPKTFGVRVLVDLRESCNTFTHLLSKPSLNWDGVSVCLSDNLTFIGYKIGHAAGVKELKHGRDVCLMYLNGGACRNYLFPLRRVSSGYFLTAVKKQDKRVL